MRRLLLGMAAGLVGCLVYRLGHSAGSREGFLRSAIYLRALRPPPDHRLRNPTRWREVVDDEVLLRNAAPNNGGRHGGQG